jgi:hypothetical protein
LPLSDRFSAVHAFAPRILNGECCEHSRAASSPKSSVNSIREVRESPENIVDGLNYPSMSPHSSASISTYGLVPIWNRSHLYNAIRHRLSPRSPSMMGSQYNVAKRSSNCIGECSATISGFFLISSLIMMSMRLRGNILYWWKRRFRAVLIPIWACALLLLQASVFCKQIPKTAPDGLRMDYLGETLKVFRSVHPKADCHRVHGVWAEGDPKEKWFRWINCSVATGVTFGGYELLSEANPVYPFGAYATFYKKRLIEITYTLSNATIEPLVSRLARDCGQPLDSTKDDHGAVAQASCTTTKFSVVVRTIPVQSMASDKGLINLTRNVLLFATSVTIAVSDKPTD